MAIDLDAIRRKLNQISGNNQKKDIMWRPAQDSTTNVRLLSFRDNDGQPFKELYFYYNIGPGSGYLAPHQFGKPDPFQELITKLREDGKKGDKEAYEFAKKLYPKMRVYAPVLIRGEEAAGVKLWAFGKGVYETLLGLLIDEDYGDITDPITGHDIKVTVTKKPSKTFADTEITPRPKSSKLADSDAEIKNYIDSIPDPMSLFELKSYDQLKKILDDWLAGGVDEESNDSEGTTRGGSTNDESADESQTAQEEQPKKPSKKNKKEDEISSKLEELDEAFADLDV